MTLHNRTFKTKHNLEREEKKKKLEDPTHIQLSNIAIINYFKGSKIAIKLLNDPVLNHKHT